MADFREAFDVGSEEQFRMMFANLQRHLHTSMIGIVSEASDGHALSLVPAVKLAVVDPTRTQTTYEDMAQLVGVPISFAGGGGTVLTHPAEPGDEYVLDFMARSFGNWHHMGGPTQQPETDRMHSLSDAVARPSVRSDPRRLQQVAPDAMHARSEDKLHVHEVKPGQGVRTFSAEPSTPPASANFDPLAQASTFIDHSVVGGSGLLGRAVSPDGTHSHGVTHADGAFMRALGALHEVLAHPSLGALLSAAGGAHVVKATPSGVDIASSLGIALQCPPSGLSLPSGSIGGASLAAGAASANVGPLSGDLAGTLPGAQVVGLGHVAGQDKALIQAASDSAAAAAGAAVGSLYVNTAVKSGVGVLAVRLA